MYKTMLIVLSMFCLSGCQSTPSRHEAPERAIFDDSLFPSYQSFPLEDEDTIFALNDDAKAFVDGIFRPLENRERNINTLVSAIFDHSQMGMLYRSGANSIASTTFDNRTANCLSLSIMTYALAEYAGYNATFYSVEIPEYWTRRAGFSFLNGHVNLRVEVKDDPFITFIGPSKVDVDFDPQMIRSHFPRNVVSKKNIIAMFYNNKGAEALIANSYSRAYRYFKAAAQLAPDVQESWVNLGVLYRMVDAYEVSEVAYQYAIANDDNNLTAWENLAILYNYQGRKEASKEIIDMVELRRSSNPFYHFILGEQAFDKGKVDDAIRFYHKARKLDSSRHEFAFGLAKAYLEAGDVSNAQDYLTLAKRLATDEQEKSRYQSKLTTLAGLSE